MITGNVKSVNKVVVLVDPSRDEWSVLLIKVGANAMGSNNNR